MEKLFNPQSIAVIGASRNKDKLGYQILENIISAGFKGDIYPVNPKAQEILGKKCYSNVSTIETDIDLAIIVIPKEIVKDTVETCVEKKVGFVVIISAGFAEKGQDGKALQDEIEDIVKDSNTRVLGPNCLGFFNTENGLNATFAKQNLTRGNVGAIFQSGALGVAALDWAKEFGFGFSKFVSLGNKMDLEESDVLAFLANDNLTQVIILYLEDIANTQKFLKVAKDVAAKKPVVVIKGGTTSSGAKAAFSHTAALATSNKINQAIFTQANVITAKTINEVVNLISLLSFEPEVSGKNLAILTNAGGPGILATDAAARAGLNIGKINDLTGTALADDYKTALQEFIQDSSIDSILVILTPQSMTEVEKTAKILAENNNSKKPIIASFMGDETVKKANEILKNSLVPHFSDPQEAVIALSKATKYYQKRNSNIQPLKKVKNSNNLLSDDPFDLLKNYGIIMADYKNASSFEEANIAAKRIGFPLAVKNMGRGEHKLKTGKLVLNIVTEDMLRKAISKVGLPSIIQKMIDSPYEVIVGGKTDPKIGRILLFGWGGVLTQDVNDISMRVETDEVNLTDSDLDEMIKETRIGKVLMREKLDLEPIKDVLKKVAQILSDNPKLSEIDLNPLKILEGQAVAIDIRYKLEEAN